MEGGRCVEVGFYKCDFGFGIVLFGFFEECLGWWGRGVLSEGEDVLVFSLGFREGCCCG